VIILQVKNPAPKNLTLSQPQEGDFFVERVKSDIRVSKSETNPKFELSITENN
jgi:hypothetical protein